MHALDVLGDPVRRRILELIVDGEEPAGSISDVIFEEFGISQPAVSQHLRVLRENGFVTVRPEGTRRLYAVDPHGPREASDWLSPFERFWRGPLSALGTELARGKRQRRLASERAETERTEAERAETTETTETDLTETAEAAVPAAAPSETSPDDADAPDDADTPDNADDPGESTGSADPQHHESKE